MNSQLPSKQHAAKQLINGDWHVVCYSWQIVSRRVNMADFLRSKPNTNVYWLEFHRRLHSSF